MTNIFSVLTIVFVIAKLTNTIDWSWWLVFLPSLINIALFVSFLVLAAWVNVKD